MPTIKLHSHSLEVPDLVFYNHVLGFTKTSCESVGIIGSIIYDDAKICLTIGHLDHLEEIYHSLNDDEIKNILKKMINLYTQAQKCNDNLLEIFAKRVQSPIPRTQSELNLIYKKLEKVVDPNYYPVILSEEGPSKIVGKQNELVNDLVENRRMIIRKVINLYPELIESEFLTDDDRTYIENHLST